MLEKIKGIGVDLITPFHKDGNIDFNSLEKIIEQVIVNKADYIVILSNTGETATLSKDEKLALMNYIIDIVNKRVPIIAGIGGNNTQKIVNLKDTFIEGIDAILSVCPYYSKPSQNGIYIHFKTIASVCPYPVLIHNIPSHTGVNIEAETTLRIAEENDNVIGIVESSTNICQSMKVIKNKPEDFRYISGNDFMTLPFLSIGAEGAISVMANAYPAEYSQMIHYCLNSDFQKAGKIYYQFIDLLNLINEDGQPAGIKALLEILDLCQNNLRLPHVKVNKNIYSLINETVHNYNKVSVKKESKVIRNYA